MKNFFKFRGNIWLCIILILCGLLANAAVLNNYRKVGSDFIQDYIAAHALRRGVPLFGEDFTKLENELIGFSGPPHFHPPFNAVIFLPFSFISYETAYIFLGAFSILLLLIINYLIIVGLKLDNKWFFYLTGFMLCWYPVIYCLGTGQSSMIITACLIGGWFCLHFKKYIFAGFAFAVATLIKLFPGLILLYLLISKNWHAFISTVFFIILGLAVTTMSVGFDDMQTYSNIMIAKYINEWSGFVLNHSVSGMVTKISGEITGWAEPLAEASHINTFLIIFLNLTVLIISVFIMRQMTVRQGLADYAFGLTIVAMLLLSPFTYGHIFPVLVFPICLLLKEYIYQPSAETLRLILVILFCLSLPDVLIARKLFEIYHSFEMPWYSMLLTMGPGIGLILLWVVLCRRARY